MTLTVVITRPRASNFKGSSSPSGSSDLSELSYQGADRLFDKVSQLGFCCIYLPVLATSRLPLTQPLSEALARLRDGYFSWLVLLSPTAVYAFKETWNDLYGVKLSGKNLSGKNLSGEKLCRDVDFPKSTKIALQGPGTAEAFQAAFSREPDLLPEVFLAEELAKSLSQVIAAYHSISSERVLILQARDGRNVVAPIVAATGATVESYPLYATEEVALPLETSATLTEIPEDDLVFLFMSPSAVRATSKYLGERHKKNSSVMCVGPITAHAAKECGFEKIVESKDHSEDGILALLSTTFKAT